MSVKKDMWYQNVQNQKEIRSCQNGWMVGGYPTPRQERKEQNKWNMYAALFTIGMIVGVLIWVGLGG